MVIPILKPSIGYKRRSDKKQLGNHSMDIQESAINSKASLLGYEIIQWFEDDAVSAYRKSSLERPGMRDLLDYALHHDIEAIFFYDETRVSRRFSDFVMQVEKPIREMKPHIKFFSTNQEGEWSAYDIHVQNKLSLGRLESEEKSKRAKDARKKMLYPSKGKPSRPGSRIPFGYQKDADQKSIIIPDNKKAMIINLIFFLSGWGMSNKQIAALLNEANIPSPENSNWGNSSIDLILHNVAYLGHYADGIRKDYYHSARNPESEYKIILNMHEPIISPILWIMVQQAKNIKKQTGKMDTPFVLRNILKCKKCNEVLITKDRSPSKATKKYLQYECNKCKGKIECDSVNLEVFTYIMKEWAAHLEQSEKYTKKLLRDWKRKLTLEKQRTKDELLDLRFKESCLALDHPFYDQWKETIENTISSLERKVEELSQLMENINILQNPGILNDFFSQLHHVNLAHFSRIELRILLFTFLKQVDIDFIHGNRLHIHFRHMPFIDLENSLVSITENKEEHMEL